MLAEKKPIFKKVVAVVKKLSADEEARMEYDKHEMWRMDYAATMRNAARKGMARGLAEGLEKGLAEGLAEGLEKGKTAGREEEKLQNARNLKRLGVPAETIAKATGLSLREIEQLN